MCREDRFSKSVKRKNGGVEGKRGCGRPRSFPEVKSKIQTTAIMMKRTQRGCYVGLGGRSLK